MLLEEVLSEVRSKNKKFDTLREDVDILKKRDRNRSHRKKTPPPQRNKSRSPRTKTYFPYLWNSRVSYAEATRGSWADTDPNEKADYSAALRFSDEEDPVESDLIEVSKETHTLLTTLCTWSVPNEARCRTRSQYGLPKVAATRATKLANFMKSDTSQEVKSELAHIQTFVLDALSPLTAILEDKKRQSMPH